MQSNNICRFIPYNSSNDRINTIYYVYETKQQFFTTMKQSLVYTMAIVKSGRGILHTANKNIDLKVGDIFFIFASSYYAIESLEDFRYIYISFIGTRTNAIMDALKISPQNCLFEGFESLVPLWESGFDTKNDYSDIMSEGILLYTFSVLGNTLYEEESEKAAPKSVVRTVKKYIDDNFSNTDLSTETISRELSYNKKYLSATFKKSFGIGISEYMMVIRIQHACALMDQGFKHIKEIAALCGYNDPMYFSKVFRKRMQVTPTEYISGVYNT